MLLFGWIDMSKKKCLSYKWIFSSGKHISSTIIIKVESSKITTISIYVQIYSHGNCFMSAISISTCTVLGNDENFMVHLVYLTFKFNQFYMYFLYIYS